LRERVGRGLERIAIAATIVFVTAAATQAGDAAAGKAKARLCVACHGANGVAAMPGTPSLAGQTDAFLQWQLVYFRSGARKNDLMSPVAEGLSDDDVQNLGAYFATLPPPAPAAGPLDAALMADGVKVAAKYRCASCHQRDYAGLEQAARLAAQREEYLVKSLRDFKSGARRGGGGAGAMPDVAFPMTEAEIKAVAYYLAHHP
jgi:cytochrome c553